jgi:hypothetical protein
MVMIFSLVIMDYSQPKMKPRICCTVSPDMQSQVFETLVACRFVEQFKENQGRDIHGQIPMRVEQKTMSH